jgi:hypothetical protein
VSGAGSWRRSARALPLLLLTGLSACAYFNGIYNAREAQRHADKQARRGREAEAAGRYATMAQKAETVLARFPKSRWRGEALYLAGRGHALAGACEQALPRLDEYLAMGGDDARQRERATLALASCHVRLGRYADARVLLEPLTQSKDREVSERALLWSARAAIALGDNETARRHLARVDVAAAQWELAAASIERGELARAESLLVARAARGDWREDAEAHLRELWVSGARDAAERVVARYAESRAASRAKARMHLTIARLAMAEEEPGLDSIARVHLLAARRVAVDTLIDREASARLAAIAASEARTLEDLGASLERHREDARSHPLMQRLLDNAMLIRILARTEDRTGGTLFLAAELARDSLGANYLSRALYQRLAATQSDALLAPRALLAAMPLWPDSAAAFRERIITDYSRTPYAALLEGVGIDRAPGYEQAERALRDAWRVGMQAFGDSLNERRQATTTAAAPASPTPPSP